MAYIYRAWQQARLRRYIGVTVGKYETTKQEVSNEELYYYFNFKSQLKKMGY